jgi:hypothetical protein
VVVEGYFLPPHHSKKHPTVLDVLGPAYASRNPSDVHIDNTVLEDVRVDEKADILREARLSQTQDRSGFIKGDGGPNREGHIFHPSAIA